MSEKLIQLKGVDSNGTSIEVFPYTRPKAIIFDNGKTLEEQILNHKHNLATVSIDGMMSKNDFAKLLNIEPNANKYYHPSTHQSQMITHGDKTLEQIINELLTKISDMQTEIDSLKSKFNAQIDTKR